MGLRVWPGARSAAPVVDLDHPKTSPSVEVIEPVEDSESWLVRRDTKYLRVGRDLAHLVELLDGSRSPAEIAAQLGPRWSAEAVAGAVDKLAASGLLDDGTAPSTGTQWVKFVPPLTLQLTVLRPARVLAPIARATGWLAGPAGVVLLALLPLGGLAALVGQFGQARELISTPVSPLVFVVVLLAFTLATTAHELSHGVVLLQQGGRPTRMGVMLFYLAPAMFCDVSDAWRLPRPRQRVVVALAGVVTQATLGGLAAWLALLGAGGQTVHDALLIFAVGSYLAGLINLVPLVKLDGYIALMSHLDRPNLLARSKTDARRALARLLFGGRRGERELPDWRFALPFGLAAMVFPVYLVATVITVYLDVLGRAGIIGALILALAAAYLLAVLITAAARVVREGRRGGATIRRIAAASALVVTGVAAALAFIPVTLSVPGGYVDGPSGPLFVVQGADGSADVAPGDEVTVTTSGLLLSTTTGRATVAAGEPSRTTVPLEVFAPLDTDGVVEVAATGWPVTAAGPVPAQGAATADVGQRPLGQWLFLTYLAPALP